MKLSDGLAPKKPAFRLIFHALELTDSAQNIIYPVYNLSMLNNMESMDAIMFLRFTSCFTESSL